MVRTIFPLIIGDVIGFILAFILSYLTFILYTGVDLPLSKQIIPLELLAFYVVQAIAGVLYFLQKGHYKLSTPWWQQVKNISLFCIFSLLLLCFLFFVVKADPSRFFIVLSLISLIPLLMMARQLTRQIMVKRNQWSIPTIIIGGFENATETIYALKSEGYVNYDIKEIILPKATLAQMKKFQDIHVEYEVKKDIPEFNDSDIIIICPDTRRELELAELTGKITAAGADFAMVPPIEGFSYYGLQPNYFFGYNIILLRNPNKLKRLNQLLKNIIDRAGAVFGLLALSPIFLFVSYKVKQDGGPVFFGHTRIGKDGKSFKCWKFRSMVTNSKEVLDDILANDPAARDEWDRDFKLKNDPRITKIGTLIRKTSIDEIPQLFNVLMGEMSLVGPRPIVKDEVKYYGSMIKDYYSVNPGITGLWQVSGRNDITYDQRVYLDSWYVRHWSIWTDIVIIIKTVFVVSKTTGAY
ncbi:MAG: UDP-phosphate galactose phosphotransferase [Alphaproteobacteria bacterium]|nr:MAG: UDP-phosphate galactose phosphotransferase [Alphaproteobacteria bacterium]